MHRLPDLLLPPAVSVLLLSGCPASSDTGDAMVDDGSGSSGTAAGSDTTAAGDPSTGAAEDTTTGVGPSEGSGTTDGGADESTGGSTASTVVYVNFDGGEFTMGADNSATNTSGAYGGTIAPYEGDRADVLSRIAGHFAAFDVAVVDQRPAAGPYTMAVIGGTDQNLPYEGIAPLDCGNTHDRDIVFTFFAGPPFGPSGQSSARLAALTSSAIAASFGVQHHDDPDDLAAFDPSNEAQFLDECIALMSSQCPAQSDACGADERNSLQELLAVLGPA